MALSQRATPSMLAPACASWDQFDNYDWSAWRRVCRCCVAPGSPVGSSVVTNKRGWHIPTIRLTHPIQVEGQERRDDPALTYYLITCRLCTVGVRSHHGFSAQTVTAIAQGREEPYGLRSPADHHPRVARNCDDCPHSCLSGRLMHLAPVMFTIRRAGLQSLVLSPLGRSGW